MELTPGNFLSFLKIALFFGLAAFILFGSQWNSLPEIARYGLAAGLVIYGSVRAVMIYQKIKKEPEQEEQ